MAWPARDNGKNPAPSGESRRRQQPPFNAPDPHEEPTRLVGSRSGAPAYETSDDNDAENVRGSSAYEAAPVSRRPTQANRTSTANHAWDEPVEAADDTTRLVTAADTVQDDPVVGWLVVVDGPGRGRSLEIGAGANPIGRASDQKLCLNFGDTRISRERHAVVIYDPVSRRFFLQNGPVRNLTYRGSEVVLEPVQLNPGDTIKVGNTRLHFIPYCGPQFGWS